MPQSGPAPQRSPIASTVRAPDRTTASISRSVMHLQMQRTISRSVESDTDSQHQHDSTSFPPVQAPRSARIGAPAEGGRKAHDLPMTGRAQVSAENARPPRAPPY